VEIREPGVPGRPVLVPDTPPKSGPLVQKYLPCGAWKCIRNRDIVLNSSYVSLQEVPKGFSSEVKTESGISIPSPGRPQRLEFLTLGKVRVLETWMSAFRKEMRETVNVVSLVQEGGTERLMDLR
jgi:hypothetical protein